MIIPFNHSIEDPKTVQFHEQFNATYFYLALLDKLQHTNSLTKIPQSLVANALSQRSKKPLTHSASYA